MKTTLFKPGDEVTYIPRGLNRDKDREFGVVTSVNDRFVFVRYEGKTGSQATDPIDLWFGNHIIKKDL